MLRELPVSGRVPGGNMFDDAKNMMDNAISHNDALSHIENQKAGQSQPHMLRNWLVGLAVVVIGIALLIIF